MNKKRRKTPTIMKKTLKKKIQDKYKIHENNR